MLEIPREGEFPGLETDPSSGKATTHGAGLSTARRGALRLPASLRGIFRAEMARQNVSYLQLVERLESIGVTDDERNLRNKVSRGKFTAAFMLQCLSALGAETLHLR